MRAIKFTGTQIHICKRCSGGFGLQCLV